jgi:pimeloyl-[acyl-carrier protein] synthase
MMVLDDPSLVELFEPQWTADPYPYYRLLREQHPVYWDGPLRSWVLTRYEDIAALGRDPRLCEDRITPFYNRLSPAKRVAMAPLAGQLRDMMLFADVPRHTALRGLTKGAFTRGAIERLRGSIVATVRDLLERAGPAGRLDLVGDFAEPLTRAVIADLLGLSEDDRVLLDDWTSLLHEFFTQSSAENGRLTQLRKVFDTMVADREREPAPDLVSHMIAAGGQASPDAMFANFLLIIDAGQVTTTHLIPNGVRALIQFPDQWDLLCGRPELVPEAAHELMRYDSSVQFTTRVATADIEVGSAVIRAGDAVTLLLASGNRDPERFPDPDRLDVTRDARGHLSFGHGIHYCLGAPLGLAEIELALAALTKRLRGLRLADPVLRWQESINFRFLRALPLTFTWAS